MVLYPRTLVCKIRIDIAYSQKRICFLKVDNLFTVNNPSGKEFHKEMELVYVFKNNYVAVLYFMFKFVPSTPCFIARED